VLVRDGLSYGAIDRTFESGSPIPFVTTHCSVAQQAQTESAEATAALEQLCWDYWRRFTHCEVAVSRSRRKTAFRISSLDRLPEGASTMSGKRKAVCVSVLCHSSIFLAPKPR
jgi:hypothetical protein